jgi:flavodoxin I
MSKTAVVFWSGTGNTEEMANAVLEGMKENGADASIYSADVFQAGDVEGYDAIAFGCPAMGAEVLEEDEFQPLFDECKLALAGKKVALFGSYGWGDGEWMRNWEDDCKEAGIELACDSVVCNDAPDEDAITACKELGAALA